VSTDHVHADGRPQFFEYIDRLMEFQEGHIRITAPAVSLSSVDLARTSRVPLSILAWSHSCHVGAFACGTCRGCVKHAATMKELGYEDY
jgi:7-cyano-7-deazaguanine synthase